MIRFGVPLLAAVVLLAAPSYVDARDLGSIPYQRLPLPAESPFDRPPGGPQAAARAETTWFGSYEVIDGEFHALRGSVKSDVMWTFDRGTGPQGVPGRIDGGEGWSEIDRSSQEGPFFRVIDASLDLGPGVPPPILAGEGSLWIGLDRADASARCWECLAGYGNAWTQRAVSPPLPYDGTGSVHLQFQYFEDSEACYDGTQVFLRRSDGTELLLNLDTSCIPIPEFDLGFHGQVGSPEAPASYAREVLASEIGGAQDIRIVFEFHSDGGWSDEDGDYCTEQGPFAVDDIEISGAGIDAAYDFEGDLQGWTPAAGPGAGLFAGIAPFDCYGIEDACACRLSGNILEQHAGQCATGNHPHGQLTRLESPICDLGPGEHETFFDLDLYGQSFPGGQGLLIRPGWRYYPYACPVTGEIQWSPRVGQEAWYFWDDFGCQNVRFSATGVGVPETAEKVIAVLDLLADCSVIPCDGLDGFGPLYDNLAVGMTAAVHAPTIAPDYLTLYQDVGSYPSQLFDLRAPGPANVSYDKNYGQPSHRVLCGDSLVVVGPPPGNDPNRRWESRLWWRVAQRAPFQADIENGAPSRYKLWKDRVSKGLAIDRPYRPEFTWGWMDSVQIGSVPYRNKFKSDYRENEVQFRGENHPETEMIWDDVLRPGSRIEYFVTSNYIGTPSVVYYLPDTTGGFLFEFEILPNVRIVNLDGCGGAGFDFCAAFPATLYIDAYNAGAQFFIENALRSVLNGEPLCADPEGCPIPRDRNWDRFDYSSIANHAAPFARGDLPGSNNGMHLNQILGYRSILLNTGSFGQGSMKERDFELFDAWLTSPDCNANLDRQVFLMSGDGAGELLSTLPEHGAPFLNDVLGATLVCDAFNGQSEDPDCGPENLSPCVRLLPPELAAFGTEIDIDMYGNGCPDVFESDVLGTQGSGAGNRFYSAEDGLKDADFAQIVHQDLGGGANFRTVLDGTSWHHMTRRDPGGSGPDRCPRDAPSVVAAIAAEIGSALRWGFGVDENEDLPRLALAEGLQVCQNTLSLPSQVGEAENARVNRLYPNEPNPFNPRTTIRFSLAQPGEVQLLIYDVNGRLVRTLVDAKKDAGLHTSVWDGTNDDDHRVGSGVYWSQMKAGSFVSSKKMVILK